MSKQPKIRELSYLFNSKSKFSLTEAQYEKLTGARLPKDTYYLLKNSALAKECLKQGFKLTLQEKTVIFERK